MGHHSKDKESKDKDKDKDKEKEAKADKSDHKDPKEGTSSEQSGDGASGSCMVQGNINNNGNGLDNNETTPTLKVTPVNNMSPNNNGAIGETPINNKQSLKHLSVSAPAMRSTSKAGSETDLTVFHPSSSKSRQKKFHRHFKTVPLEEKVLDYYSCALVADILLQGYLYITENYFGFYSNVFGYVSKILIPIASVVRITKEKTAKIIPNAVGIFTQTEKHVFASLLSRETTYKLMIRVWNYNLEHINLEQDEIILAALERNGEDSASQDIPDKGAEESSDSVGSGNDSAMDGSSYAPSPMNTPGEVTKVRANACTQSSPVRTPSSASRTGSPKKNSVKVSHSSVSSVPTPSSTGTPHSPAYPMVNPLGSNQRLGQSTSAATPNLNNSGSSRTDKSFNTVGGLRSSSGPSLLILATFLLVLATLSAGLLLSRISTLQQKINDRYSIRDSEHFYEELAQWQNKLHFTSSEEIHSFIDVNLRQIRRVRESLEALSLLFINRPSSISPPEMDSNRS